MGAATINERDAEAISVEGYVVANTVVSLAFGTPTFLGGDPRIIEQHKRGSGGGWAFTKGRVRADHTGWLSINYVNYKYTDPSTGNTYTYNGTIQSQYTAPDQVTLVLSSLRLSGDEVDQTISGAIVFSQSEDAQGVEQPHYVANLVLTDNLVQASIKAADFVVDGGKTQTVMGRLYDSRFGYVDVATFEPLQYKAEDGSTPPFAGGPLVASSNGRSARLAPLNKAFAAVGLDLDGDRMADESLRMDWQTGLPDTTPTPAGRPEANLAAATNAVIDQPVALEGRFSHAPNGSFLHYHWQLELAPVGSQAQITAPLSATPTLTPDVPGDYLVRLDVSDASGSSTDTLVVTAAATAPPADSTFMPRSVLDAGPDRTATLGKPVTLDARTSVIVDDDAYDPANYQWTLHAPPGSHAVFNNAQTARPEFTPDIPGNYYATLSTTDPTDTATSDVIVSVGDAPHFDRPVALIKNVNNTRMAVGDLNGDGLPDIVLDGAPYSNSLELLYATAAGRFAAPVEIDGDAGVAVAIADVDGDGRADLITAADNSIAYRLQQSDGSMGPATDIEADPGADCMESTGLIIARLFGQSLPSLLVQCRYGVLVYGRTSGGALGKPWFQSFGAPRLLGYSGLAVADVTSDGIADLVGGYPAAIYTGNDLVVVAGNADGTFAATPATYTLLDSSPGPVATADFNQDGKRDVAMFRYGAIDLFDQQADGTLSARQTLTLAIPATDMTVADTNNDGRTDLVLRNGNHWNGSTSIDPQSIAIYPQQRGGGFSGAFFYPGVSPMKSGAIRVVDINADGVADLMSLQDGQLDVMLGDPLTSDAASVTTMQFERPKTTKRPAAPVGESTRFPFAAGLRADR
ncbi:MAG TPA: FG-GAP-like repeat-containing protein [Gammaproteobacteria bacterium]|nr:FG-GAP-like repeat-containing protein [Gammaproteobacteria bacterium]